MRPVLGIALLLLSAAVVESLVEQTEEGDFTPQLKHHGRKTATLPQDQIVMDGAFPGSCSACKSVVSRVKDMLGKDSSKEKINRLLTKACDRIKVKLIRGACKKIVGQFKAKLIDHIANHEDAKAICVKIKLCK